MLGMKIVILFLIVSFGKDIANGQTVQIIPSNNAEVHQWVEQNFAKGKIPPFSFVYGGKSSNNFIQNWQYHSERLKSSEPNSEETVYIYSDKQSGLIVKCFVTCFSDFPAVEWVLYFSNTSGKNTPFLEKTAVIDYSFVSEEEGTFMLYRARGSNAGRTDFQPIDEKMEVGKSIYMTPAGGRSAAS